MDFDAKELEYKKKENEFHVKLEDKNFSIQLLHEKCEKLDKENIELVINIYLYNLFLEIQGMLFKNVK
jgi:hypothetical protein